MTVIPIDSRQGNAVSVDATDIVLTIEEAAQWLKVGRTLMCQLIRTGEVESVTIGRLRRVPLDCLKEYVARLRANARQMKNAA